MKPKSYLSLRELPEFDSKVVVVNCKVVRAALLRESGKWERFVGKTV